MTEMRHTLSREQVMRTERRAWACGTNTGGRDYSFDGINFWRHRGRGDAELVAPWRTPTTGWRHRAGCTCGECSPLAVT